MNCKWHPILENPPESDWYIVWVKDKAGAEYWTQALFSKGDSVWGEILSGGELYNITHWTTGPNKPE